MKHKDKLAYAIILIAIFISQFGCTFKTLQMTKEEIQQPKDTEGIIIGSIFVEAKEPESDSGWQTFWKGKKASDFKYKFLVSKIDDYKDSYQIIVDPNNEKTFISKLNSGDYHIWRIWVVYVSDYLYTDTDIRFTVTPQKETYIGKLVVSFPERVKMFSKFVMKIEDAQAAAVAQVKKEVALDENMVLKSLMHVQKK
jgi:hypothetical protein